MNRRSDFIAAFKVFERQVGIAVSERVDVCLEFGDACLENIDFGLAGGQFVAALLFRRVGLFYQVIERLAHRMKRFVTVGQATTDDRQSTAQLSQPLVGLHPALRQFGRPH